jgi:hypothetical protein
MCQRKWCNYWTSTKGGVVICKRRANLTAAVSGGQGSRPYPDTGCGISMAKTSHRSRFALSSLVPRVNTARCTLNT